MSLKKIVSLIMVVTMSLSVLFCFSGCNDRKKVIRINASNSYGNMTTNIMMKYGLLEKYLPDGYEIEWSNMTSASDMRDALVSGKVDIICTSLSTYIINYENGMPLTLISFASGVPIGLYTNDENIQSIKDIGDNQQILTKSKSNNGHIAFLVESKMKLGDYMALDDNLVLLSENEAISSLTTSNNYVAGNFSFPMNVKAENAGLVKIADYNEIVNEYGIGSCYMTTDTYYKNNPEIIESFKKAQEEALIILENNPEEVAQKIEEDYGLEASVILDAIKEMPPTNKIRGYNILAELLYDVGLIENSPRKFEELDNYGDLKYD